MRLSVPDSSNRSEWKIRRLFPAEVHPLREQTEVHFPVDRQRAS